MISADSMRLSSPMLGPQPLIRPPIYTSFTPVSPRRNTVPSPSKLIPTTAITTTSTQIPVPRFPEVPIMVLKESSLSSPPNSYIRSPKKPQTSLSSVRYAPYVSSSSSYSSQGLLAPYIPAPYEQGPDGLILIMPRKINSSVSSYNKQYINTAILSAK